MDSKETGDVNIPKRVLNTLISSLEAGVVPRVGAPYIAIGRNEEIATLLDSLSAVADGGAACRFLIGRYGSGKSFLIQLIRGYALDRDFLTADADLSPERKLSGTGGLGTYRELMRNLACKASPDGGALPIVLSRYFNNIETELTEKGADTGARDYTDKLLSEISARLSSLESGVGGFEFVRILNSYFAATVQDNADRRSACLRWLRGEYANKTEARAGLGFYIGTVIDDTNWYDYLKLWANFSSGIGYRGLIVYIDECINLYKISNRVSREANYEKLLAIFNDTLQGRAEHLGVIFGGTPQFLEDTRRGLFSYDALRSRLSDARLAELGYRNLSSPVIRLRRLSDNELLALIRRLAKLWAKRHGTSVPVTDEESERFLRYELSRVGADELVTPREIIRDFLTLASVLKDNPGVDFDALVKRVSVSEGDESNRENAENTQDTAGQTSSFTLADIDI